MSYYIITRPDLAKAGDECNLYMTRGEEVDKTVMSIPFDAALNVATDKAHNGWVVEVMHNASGKRIAIFVP